MEGAKQNENNTQMPSLDRDTSRNITSHSLWHVADPDLLAIRRDIPHGSDNSWRAHAAGILDLAGQDC